jgi:hypothetical protein
MSRKSVQKWIKSCESAHCVEVMIQKTQVKLRDSKDPSRPTLTFTHEEWQQFLDGANRGVFDL